MRPQGTLDSGPSRSGSRPADPDESLPRSRSGAPSPPPRSASASSASGWRVRGSSLGSTRAAVEDRLVAFGRPARGHPAGARDPPAPDGHFEPGLGRPLLAAAAPDLPDAVAQADPLPRGQPWGSCLAQLLPAWGDRALLGHDHVDQVPVEQHRIGHPDEVAQAAFLVGGLDVEGGVTQHAAQPGLVEREVGDTHPRDRVDPTGQDPRDTHDADVGDDVARVALGQPNEDQHE